MCLSCAPYTTVYVSQSPGALILGRPVHDISLSRVAVGD